MINLYSYLFISGILFFLGLVTIISRKNIIAVLLGVELILNASALNFVAYSKFLHQSMDAHVISLFIIIIAAAEAAVALAISIRFFQVNKSMHLDDAKYLKG